MDGLRFRILAGAALAISFAIPAPSIAYWPVPSANKVVTEVYNVADFAKDAALAQWIVDTIPKVIEPDSWQAKTFVYEDAPGRTWQLGKVYGPGGPGEMRYFAPAKVMVVSQTPAVHAQIGMFLRKMATALPKQATPAAMNTPAGDKVVPASFATPAPSGITNTNGNPAAYLVPAPAQQPKHLFHLVVRYEGDGAAAAELAKKVTGNGGASEEATGLGQLFHFILRYEGEGLIDANVVKAMRLATAANKETGSDLYGRLPTPPPTVPVPALPAPPTVLYSAPPISEPPTPVFGKEREELPPPSPWVEDDGY